MNSDIEIAKLSLASFLGVFASVFGETHKHIIALIVLMVIDTIFGWIKGFKKGEWTSKKDRWGIAGKIVELLLISLLYVLNWVFKVDFMVYIGLYYFISVEIASIFENYAEINGNLPKGFLELMQKLQFNVGTLAVSKVKNFIDRLFNNGDDKNENK